jgi:hypothetical protein
MHYFRFSNENTFTPSLIGVEVQSFILVLDKDETVQEVSCGSGSQHGGGEPSVVPAVPQPPHERRCVSIGRGTQQHGSASNDECCQVSDIGEYKRNVLSCHVGKGPFYFFQIKLSCKY